MTRRLYPLILLPAFSLAVFLFELMRRHGYESLDQAWFLVIVPIFVVVSLPAFWVVYSVSLSRFAGVDPDRALRLDLISYLPLLLLATYFLPAVANVLHIGTILFFTSLVCVALAKAAILLYYRRSMLHGLLSHPYLVLALIVGLAAMLRVSLMAVNRFHGDEALYSHWALLIASGKDVFLRGGQIVDKPPVFLYTLAFFFKVFGNTETAARLPNVLASLAGVAVVYHISLELFDRRVATVSAILLTLSPYDIQFAPTAFTDPLMVTLAMASCLLALKHRYLGAGTVFGLAVMTKPTAVIFAPLLLIFSAVTSVDVESRRRLGRSALMLAMGFIAVILAVVSWDVVIRINCLNFLSASAARYGGLRLLHLERLVPRLQGWMEHLQYLTGSRVLNVTLIVGVICLLAYGLWRRRVRERWAFDWILASFGLYFVAMHTVLSFGVWDRYMLGLAPIVAILLARVLLLPRDVFVKGEGLELGNVAYFAVLAAFLAVSLLHPAQVALRYGFPIGGDHGSFQGIDDVANYFKGNAAEGSIVFHKWLLWHYLYYMFDLPLDYYYYPSFEFVLDTSRQLSTYEKYIVFPSWTNPDGLASFLRESGWEMLELHNTYRPNGTVSFTIYRIQPAGE
ncbi:MAG: glycosyltransferase family 39 protein [Anaerolineae bacterium]